MDPRPPRRGGSSPAQMAVMNDESIVPHVFVGGQLVTSDRNRPTQQNFIIRSSTESDNNLREQLGWPLPASAPQFAAPVDTRDSTVSQTMGSDVPYDEWIEHQPIDEVDTGFIQHTPNAVQRHELTRQAEERRERWIFIETQINYEDAAIAQIVSFMSPFDFCPGDDYYVRYVRLAWMCGPDPMTEAKTRLNNKLRNHERYLEEVNEVIALDPHISPGDVCYDLRVYNINERARVLNALDQYEEFIRREGAAGMNNPNDPGGIVIQSAHQNPTHMRMQPGRTIDRGSYANLSTDGTNEVERASTNRGIEIIDPDTGHPIQFQRQPLTTTNTNRNDTGRTNGKYSNCDNVPVDGSSELLIRDDVDRRSELFHGNETIGNVPTGSNDPLLDANSRLDGLFPLGIERRPRNGSRISRTLPRNFGRKIANLRSAFHSITEPDHEHAIELTGTAGNDGNTPNLAFSVTEHEMNHGATQNGVGYLQNECRVASVSSSSDDEQQTMRDSNPGPGPKEEMLSELSFDRQHGSTEVADYQASLIPPDFFDVFVVDVDGDREVEGSGERRGRPSAEQSKDATHHSFGADYPDDISDTPLLSRNSPYGRYGPLSRNSPSRAVSRSSARRKHYGPVGGLSSFGSRMITSSLNARQRHDTRENVRNARRSLRNSSRLRDDLRGEVPATTVLGFDAPDSQQNTNYLPVYSTQLIDASVRHTAPAIVNTSRINVYARL
ncbi:hypothetical protein N7536_001371 [Penicillium majusculum]|nr:hypothetical protein N7536_001371 [Penicillium majusculum]